MERTLRALIPNEPEVLMRVTALLKRKGYGMRRILMEEEQTAGRAWLQITFNAGSPQFSGALHTVSKVIDVQSVEEVLMASEAL